MAFGHVPLLHSRNLSSLFTEQREVAQAIIPRRMFVLQINLLLLRKAKIYHLTQGLAADIRSAS
jgi:hypothetical protein